MNQSIASEARYYPYYKNDKLLLWQKFVKKDTNEVTR